MTDVHPRPSNSGPSRGGSYRRTHLGKALLKAELVSSVLVSLAPRRGHGAASVSQTCLTWKPFFMQSAWDWGSTEHTLGTLTPTYTSLLAPCQLALLKAGLRCKEMVTTATGVWKRRWLKTEKPRGRSADGEAAVSVTGQLVAGGGRSLLRGNPVRVCRNPGRCCSFPCWPAAGPLRGDRAGGLAPGPS